MDKKRFDINLSIKEKNTAVLKGLTQFENGIYFDFNIVDDNELFDISGFTNIVLTIMKPDGTFYIDSLGDTFYRTEDKGVLVGRMMEQCFINRGRHELIIEFFKGTDRYCTSELIYNVYHNINEHSEEAIKSDDDLPFLENLMTQITLLMEKLLEGGVYSKIVNALIAKSVNTDNKFENYLKGDLSPISYHLMQDQLYSLITGTTDGLQEVQLVDPFGVSLYWKDETHTAMTEENTGLPVMEYVYDEKHSLSLLFREDPETGFVMPMFDLAYASVEGDDKLGHGFFYNREDGLFFDYYTRGGELRRIALTEEGLLISPSGLQELKFFKNGFTAIYPFAKMSYRSTEDDLGRLILLESLDGQRVPISWSEENI